jgi:glycine hydroxymethyltransferase
MNGLRFGTPELVRWGMTTADAPRLAGLIARGLEGAAVAEDVAAEVSAWRRSFDRLHFIH